MTIFFRYSSTVRRPAGAVRLLHHRWLTPPANVRSTSGALRSLVNLTWLNNQAGVCGPES